MAKSTAAISQCCIARENQLADRKQIAVAPIAK
jgi:hypothetical protein